jgi:DNA-binding MarR family transcriptional regulator
VIGLNDLSEYEKVLLQMIYKAAGREAVLQRQLYNIAEMLGWSGGKVTDISTQLKERGLIRMKRDPLRPVLILRVSSLLRSVLSARGA